MTTLFYADFSNDGQNPHDAAAIHHDTSRRAIIQSGTVTTARGTPGRLTPSAAVVWMAAAVFDLGVRLG